MPAARGAIDSRVSLAVIGMGLRSTHMARLMCEVDANVRVVAVADPRSDVAAQRVADAGFPDSDSIRFFFGCR